MYSKAQPVIRVTPMVERMMIKIKRVYHIISIYGKTLLPFVLLISLKVNAQNVSSIEVRVIQLAADQIYLQDSDIEQVSNLPSPSDTLFVYRESDFIGILNVDAVNSSRIVSSFFDNTFPVTRGEMLIVHWTSSNTELPEASDNGSDSVLITRAGQSILKRTSTQTSQSKAKVPDKITVSGRIMAMANITQSRTFWSRVLSKHDDRWSSMPSTNLSLNMQNIPGGWDVQLRSRFSYRFQTDSRINNTNQFNVYRINARKKFENAPVEVQLGRFYNTHEIRGSYWDGAMLTYAKRNWNAGIISGFEPALSNESFNADFPKLGSFFSYQIRKTNFRNDGNVSFSSVFPASTSLGNQYNVGIEQRLEYKQFRIRGELQSDRDPVNATWKITRLRIQTNLEITHWFSLRTSYQQRKPYFYQSGAPIFFDRREKYGITSTMKFGNWMVSNGIAINQRTDRNSFSINSRLQWFRSPVWDLNWSVYGTYWDSESGYSVNSGISASKNFKSFRASSGLSVYKVNVFDTDQLTGSTFLTMSKAISSSLSFSGRFQSSVGQLVRRNSLSLSLWKSF